MGHPLGDTADQFHRATSTTRAALSTAKSLIHMGLTWVARGHHRGLWTLEQAAEGWRPQQRAEKPAGEHCASNLDRWACRRNRAHSHALPPFQLSPIHDKTTI